MLRITEGDAFNPNRHRESVSDSSDGSVEPRSPDDIRRRGSVVSEASTTHVTEEQGDEPWNLVPYHIPWGHEYEGYESGTLPGRDGTCIFLRSPTPLKKQRTAQACENCRDRKAKVGAIFEVLFLRLTLDAFITSVPAKGRPVLDVLRDGLPAFMDQAIPPPRLPDPLESCHIHRRRTSYVRLPRTACAARPV